MARIVTIGQQASPQFKQATATPVHAPRYSANKMGPAIDARHQVNAKEWAESGKWVRVHSSNVAGISYKKDFSRLYVEFKGKKGSSPVVYQYEGVSQATAKALFSASSVGRAHWKLIRGRYPYARLGPPQ